MKMLLTWLLIIVSLSLLTMNVGLSEDSLQLVEVNDGIFSYSAPSNWIATTSSTNGYNYHYFFAQREGSADGGFIMECVQDLGLGENIPEHKSNDKSGRFAVHETVTFQYNQYTEHRNQ